MFKRDIITVPEPCHEDWANMSEAELGRYCQSCDKIVTDFTTMSNDEIITFLKSGKGSGCGNFLEDQLEKPLLQQRSKFSWFLPIAASLSSLLVLPDQAKAQKGDVVIVQQSVNGEDQDQANPIVKGYVRDSHSGRAIPNARVLVRPMNYQVITNSNGYFELVGFKPKDQIHFVIRHRDYDTLSLCPLIANEPLGLSLNPKKVRETPAFLKPPPLFPIYRRGRMRRTYRIKKQIGGIVAYPLRVVIYGSGMWISKAVRSSRKKKTPTVIGCPKF